MRTIPGYAIVTRAISYLGRIVSLQTNTELKKNNYSLLKKSYSIWILPNASFYKDGTIQINERSNRVICGRNFNKKRNYDKTTVIEIYIAEEHRIENKYKEFDSLLTPLCTLLSNQRNAEDKIAILNEYGFILSEESEGKVNRMCNLSQGIWENGNKHGKKIGKIEGKIEGKRIGKKIGKKQGKKQGIDLGINILKSIKIYRANHFSQDYVLKMLIKNFHITEIQAKEYISQVYE